MLGAFGGNDFKVTHKGVLERRKKEKLPALFPIDIDPFQAAVEWWHSAKKNDSG